mmetsp:Transcript_6902/g.23754  ORF Transcript_6902/g.23754 Transcript_6902/m.23754 type:complete len:505 (-) Transcript_6902:571-2085(-)
MTMMSKKKLSQEAFDAAVEDLVDGLGLEIEEAIESACEEFEIQGFCLDGIVKQKGGAEVLAKLPTAMAAAALKAALQGEKEALRSAVGSLGKELEEAANKEDTDEAARLLLASAKADAAELLLTCVDKAESEKDADLLTQSLSALLRQLSSDHARDHLVQENGPRRLVALLEAAGDEDQEARRVLLLRVCAASMAEQEEGKCGYMSWGLPKIIAGRLASFQGKADKDSLEACCQCVKGILTADDTRPTPLAMEAQFGGEFAKALSMDKDGVTASLLSCLGRVARECSETGWDPDVRECARQVALGLKKIALNDEICKKFVEDSPACVPTLLSFMTSSARDPKGKEVFQAVLQLLRQVSACDTVKKELVERDATEALCDLLEDHERMRSAGERPGGLGTVAIQSVLYVLTNMTLRSPDVAERLADLGGFDRVRQVEASYPDKPKLLRQCCLLVRNSAVRSAKVREVLLKGGMEAVVRRVKERHADQCGDVCAAALRDMGLADYNA